MTDEEALKELDSTIHKFKKTRDDPNSHMEPELLYWLNCMCVFQSALRERIERNNVTTNADYIRSLSDEEMARQLIYLAYFNEGDYDWDEDPVDNWEPYYVCSDGSRFDNEEGAIEYEVDWLKQPWEDKP